MYALLFLLLVGIVYVYSFKENFTKEKVDKVAMVMFVGAILFVLLSLLGSIGK